MTMKRYASAQILNVVPRSRFASLQKAGHFTGFEFDPKPGMLYTRVRAISARVNQNFDGFRSEELQKAAHTFVGRPVFVNHNNQDHRKTRGMILHAQYFENGTDKYIELLNELDARAYPKLAKEIIDGNIDSVSMGTDVQISVCSYCHNEATTPEEFCDHVLFHKGQVLEKYTPARGKEATLVYEDCRGLNFFEISYVFEPADETALMQEVIVPKLAGLQTEAYGETTAPPAVDTLREETLCPQCGDDGFEGLQCQWCGYAAPPEELQDPDVDAAKENDLRQDQQDADKKNQTGKEGKQTVTDTNKGLERHLAQKRLAEAQRLLDEKRQADMSRNDMGNADGKEDLARTPAGTPSVDSTDGLRSEPEHTEIADLDAPNPGFNSTPDARIDLTQPSDTSQNQAPTNTVAAVEVTAHLHEGQLYASDDCSFCGELTPSKTAAESESPSEEVTKEADHVDGVHDDAASVSQPDTRVDIQTPVENTTNDYAQSSQFATPEWDQNAQNRPSVTPEPPQSNGGGQGFAPGGQTWMSPGKKANAVQAIRLAEAYIQHGLIPSDEKFNKIAEFENLEESIAMDRIALLEDLSKVARRPQPVGEGRTASATQRVPRGVVPQFAPSMGRQATPAPINRQAGLDSASDYLLGL
ncbi:hypothetical protein [Streptomyces sp. CoH17]|uniref:hypothetical protein n=1 Tax=Streptomyces sp. CoH17 TaxID=2992806 RepID=UPI00226FCA0F|nr:hypothetical protein [Streptomyces sp. CoH17]